MTHLPAYDPDFVNPNPINPVDLPGNSQDLCVSLLQAIIAAIESPTLPHAQVPGDILQVLPNALMPGAHLDPVGRLPPLPRTIAIPFIGGIGQRNVTHELAAEMTMLAIAEFFDGSREARQRCAAVDRISIVIPKTPRFGIAASQIALRDAFV